MFKLSSLLRALLSAGIFYMTENETGGGDPGGGGVDAGGGGGGQPSPYDAVPKSWAQEHHAHWANVSPEVRKIIHDRDGSYEKGIKAYSDGHQRWGRLAGHFQDYANQPGFDAVGLYETLAQNHIALSRATPEQRQELFKELAKGYGVDLATVKAAASGQGQGQGDAPLTRKDVEEMLRGTLGQALQPIQSRFQQDTVERTRKEVDAFFSDPKNEFASEVAADILQLLNSGEARNLPAAYKLALHNNPAVFAKYVAKMAQSGAGDGQQPPGAGQQRNVKSSGEGAPSGKTRTMDDTMNEIAMKAYPGWKPRAQTS